MGNRLWLCFIVFSLLSVCPGRVHVATASNGTYGNLEEATLYAVASTQSNYFVPVPVQTVGPPRNIGNELIVLLESGVGVPTPEDVVAAVTLNSALPGLDIGNPTHARFGITNRAKGVLLDEIRAKPDSPRARLERYVVLSYPTPANLSAIKLALENNPKVLNVEENGAVGFSAFAFTNPDTLNLQQWALDILNLSTAWGYTTGHAYVGLVDTGIQTDHEDLSPTFSSGQYMGGNFRSQFSHDYGRNMDDVNESSSSKGHGTHVAGIIAATSNNGKGVTGACWNCSLMIGKTNPDNCSTVDPWCNRNGSNTDTMARAYTGLIEGGAQVINQSGFINLNGSTTSAMYSCSNDLGMLCSALAFAEERDVTMFAASGNNKWQDINFPARDYRVIAVGGIDSNSAFWDIVGCTGSSNRSIFCGSNFGDQQALVAPATGVLSTFYTGGNWAGDICKDNNVTGTGPGYGNCTGTSMSSPYAAAIGAMVRGVNPLLPKANVRDILTSYTDRNTATLIKDLSGKMGYGIPDASKAVTAALGKVQGWHLSHPPSVTDTLPNRLTPLFSLHSSAAKDYFYTTVPQMAMAAKQGTLQPQPPSPDGPVSYVSVGNSTPGYGGPPCSFGPCPFGDPKASVYIFTTENSPIAGTPPLVPLYRLSYQGVFQNNPSYVDHTYAVNAAEVDYFVNTEGYRLDGIEGYIYGTCAPVDCVPPGAVRLARRYNPATGDFAIFPESERDYMRNTEGYTHIFNNTEWIGYVYPNVDTDGDHLIDGFERLIGTCVGNPHTNGSQILDGDAVMTYSGGPTGTHSYGDPGLCHYINVSPLIYHFGSVAVSYPTSATFTVFHGGSVIQEPDLNITLGISDAHFTIPNNNNSCSTPLTAGGVCSFSVQFNPDSLATSYATLTVTSNDPSAPVIHIPLDGTGVTPPQLTVTKTGGGTGTVWSAPGTINCGPTCSGPFAYNAPVSLTAIPNTGGSIFTGWSGDCNGNGQVTMNVATKNCTANFGVCSASQAARVAGVPTTYALIADAYGAAPTGTSVLEIIASNQEESLIFSSAKDVTLRGGLDCSFGQQTQPAVTFLQGSLTLTNGSVTFDGLAIK